MLKEWRWYWRAGKVRKSLHLRFVGRLSRWENPWRVLVRWIRGGMSLRRYDLPFDGELTHAPGHQSDCYCPSGSLTEFKVSLLGLSLWGWVSRD